MKAIFILVRAITWATLFISLVLIYVPYQLISPMGSVNPESLQWQHVVGMSVGTIGAAVAVWCVLTFGTIGRGTPAPFDPPQRLVTSGPYRFARNPMYIGAGLAVCGAALYFGSWALVGYAGLLFIITHFLVLFYEEPTLLETFGHEYMQYRNRVKRWGIF